MAIKPEKNQSVIASARIVLLPTVCFQIFSCDLIYFYYYFDEKIGPINEYEWCFLSLACLHITKMYYFPEFFIHEATYLGI